MEIILATSISKENNPFHPGYGVQPPVLAGRDTLKASFQYRLNGIKKGDCNPTAIVLTGPRGCGKTALLGWVRNVAQGHKLPVVTLVKENFTSVGDLQQALVNQASKKNWSSWRGLARTISLQGRVRLPEATPEIQADFIPVPGPDQAGIQFQQELLQKISRKGLVLLIDEAHDMPTEVGKFFYDTAQSVAIENPIMLVIAGTPDLTTVLQESHATFSERAQIERIGRLTREETSKALTEPFGSDINFSPQALAAVLDETQNYPYFIQLWGKALWDTLAQSPTHLPELKEVAVARQQTVQARRELYANRVRELTSKDMLVPIAEMAWRVGEGGHPTSYDFELATQHLSVGMDRTSAQQQLLHTGFIWEAAIGQWEYGIPSLASHVRQEAVRLLHDTMQGQGSIQALATVADCFGPLSLTPMEIKTNQLREAMDQRFGAGKGDVRLNQFLALKLLIPTPVPDHVRLMAPHLVAAIMSAVKA